MDGVRAIARLNSAIGWVTVAIGVAGAFVVLTQYKTIGLGPSLAVFIIICLGAVTPFSIWAGLTALQKIHEQDGRTLYKLEEIRGTLSKLEKTLTDRPVPQDGPPTAGNTNQDEKDQKSMILERLWHGLGNRPTLSEVEGVIRQRGYAIGRDTYLYLSDQRPSGPKEKLASGTNVDVLSVEGMEWARVRTTDGKEGYVDVECVL